LKKAIDLEPSDFEAYFDYASIYEIKQMFDNARIIFEKLKKKFPDNAEVLMKLANIYYRLGETDRAVDHLKLVLKCDKTWIEAYQLLGKIFREKKEYDAAIKFLNKALGISSENFDIIHELAGLYQSINKVAKAKDLYKQCITIEPDNVTPYRDLGFLIKNENEDEALTMFLKVLETYENDTEVLSIVANIYRNKKDHDTALAFYSKCLEINPKQKNTLMNIAEINFEKGEDESAREYLNDIVQRYPNEIKAYNILGDILYNRGDYNDALSLYKKSLLIDDSDEVILIKIARIYSKLEMYEDAEGHLNRLLKMVPDHFEANIIQGDIAKNANRMEDAEKFYLSALQKEKSNITALEKISNLYFVNQNYRQAEGFFSKLSELLPDHPETIFKSAVIKYELNEFTESKIKFERLVNIDPDNYRCFYYLGMIQFKIDEWNEAVRYMKLYLDGSIDESDDEAKYIIGISYSKLKSTEYAVKYLREAKSIETKEKFMALGEIYQENNQFGDALEAYYKAESFDYDDMNLVITIGRLLVELSNYEEAVI
ncbi:tetratricopeptide repeat protein, partial [bacterium]|nr:tetratricopeptide repeat protein [bacterium]